ncbi:MAG: ANTAR domain-containing protein [Firmicutes bacterium]|nr:ANTAR domain-containing protein [Bacillota bacterium]
MQNIVLAFAKDNTSQKVRRMLASYGYEIYACCHTKAELMRCTQGIDNLLVITGFKLPDATCDEIADDIQAKIMAIIKPEQRDYIQNSDIFLVPLPTNVARLGEAVDMLVKRFAINKKKERSEEDKKIIETAKLYLMEHYLMDEPAAHRFLQKHSMDTGSTLVKTARMILKK